MAEIRTTASVKPVTTVQAKKTSNSISWIAPVLCVLVGYLIWRFGLGAAGNFEKPGTGWFWPDHHGPKAQIYNMYLGGIVVPILLGTFLTCIVFVIERFLTISKAAGTKNNADFVRQVQYHLANKNVDAALAECDKQKGSVGNVMKAGLIRYKDMMTNNELNTEQKVLAIQKEVEEATALELPMLEKNLVFLSTIAS
ncbi:MAG: MotA/TolQ/ExbB proton channel family protein, partial [Chitinophagaceae bacterium]